ncbi:MAG: type II secretion system protein [Candidatus Riflebacteria bacterium]
MKFFSLRTQRGITLVEILIGTGLISLIILVVTNFSSTMSMNYKRGFSDLENFREAHAAIIQLRKDFSMACPYMSKSDGIQELKKYTLRPFAISVGDGSIVGANRKIRVFPHQLTFFRFADPSFSDNPMPVVEEVEYLFDSAEKVLIRKHLGKTNKFAGFKEMEFKAFVHAANPDVPVLWVKMVFDQVSEGSSARPLELTTSISGCFVGDAINFRNWQYRTYHRNN